MKQLTRKELKKFFKTISQRDKEIVLLCENIEYARNVANIFRTADAGGVEKIYLTGVSAYPPFGKELRKASRSKEYSVGWDYEPESIPIIKNLKSEGFYIIAIEITDKCSPLSELKNLIKNKKKICLVAGSEMFGIKKDTLELVDLAVYIPMYGKGASLNVSTAVGITLYNF